MRLTLSYTRRLAVAAVTCPFLFGIVNARVQTKTAVSALPKFEVASVKPSPGTGGQLAEERNRGWGDVTGRVNLRSIPLRYVLQKVYDLQAYQLSGPAWLDTEPFDILATVPAGAPKDQIPLMFQDLLADRFKLKFHRETQTATSYALVVGEGGPKLKEALPDDGSEVPSTVKIAGSDEKKSISGMGNGKFGKFKLTAANGVLHYEFASMTAKALAEFLSQGSVDLPVVDMTELRGSYQMPLDIPARGFPAAQSDAGQPVPAASEPSGTSVRSSLEKLGLRLVRRRFPIEKFVIDHIERRPTPN